MARIRTIKPEFPQSETIGKLSRDARLLFIQLWTIADDEGRARAASRMLASLLYPYDDDAPELVKGWLDELEQKGCIRRYVVDGSSYLEITNWLKHQKIDKPSKSRLPEFREQSPNPREPSRSLAMDLGPRTMDQDQGPSLSVADATPTNSAIAPKMFDEFWKAYPKREGANPREPARKKFISAIKSGAIPEAIIAGARKYSEEARARGQAGTQYIAQAKTWLEQKRWDDYQPLPDDPDRRAREDALFAKHGYVWDEEKGSFVQKERAA